MDESLGRHNLDDVVTSLLRTGVIVMQHPQLAHDKTELDKLARTQLSQLVELDVREIAAICVMIASFATSSVVTLANAIDEDPMETFDMLCRGAIDIGGAIGGMS